MTSATHRRAARLSGLRLPLLVGATLAGVAPAHARAHADLAWPLADVFDIAVRFVRVDRECRIIDRDRDAAYIAFDCAAEGADRTRKGALELIRLKREGGEVLRAQVALSDEPRYVELRFLELLERKIREERGPAPPRRAPTTPPPPPPDGGT